MASIYPPGFDHLAVHSPITFWRQAIGDPSDFSLESRIFHSISLCLVILTGFYVPYNLLAGLYVAALSTLIISAVFAIQYYYSRFKGKKHSTVLFAVMGFTLLAINHFANAGINGSTDLMWHSYLLLLLIISPYRQNLMWLIICLALFATLHIIEYHHPGLVKHPFQPGLGQFIDRITAFPLPIITIYIIIKYIRRSYDREKLLVEARNQEILHQKELLEQSNAEKNKLMSIISHDMRAPLINIQGYLELLNADVILPEERPALERELLLANNNTMQMLSNMLYWTKTQMEDPALHITYSDLLQILQSTLEMQQTLADKKGIALSYYIGTGLMVYADVDMLQLVVRNLVSNAIKFTPAGGTITVTATPEAGECKITIADTGMGIKPAMSEQIFRITTEPAYGTNNEKGVGLGLTLSKEYIEKQGGRIGYESVFGQGASFFVFVPMTTAE